LTICSRRIPKRWTGCSVGQSPKPGAPDTRPASAQLSTTRIDRGILHTNTQFFLPTSRTPVYIERDIRKFGVKSCATVSYPIPSDPEGSSGQYWYGAIQFSLASFIINSPPSVALVGAARSMPRQLLSMVGRALSPFGLSLRVARPITTRTSVPRLRKDSRSDALHFVATTADVRLCHT
jgi:hypothetical protein